MLINGFKIIAYVWGLPSDHRECLRATLRYRGPVRQGWRGWAVQCHSTHLPGARVSSTSSVFTLSPLPYRVGIVLYWMLVLIP